MTSEERVMALLEEGNPATRVDDAAWKDMGAPEYLSRLRESEPSDLVEVDEGGLSRTTQVRRIATAAAVFVLVAGLVMVLLTNDNEEAPVVTNPPTPTTLLQTPTTISTNPGDRLEGFWAGSRLTIHFTEDEYQIIEDNVVTDSGRYEFREPGSLTLITTEDSARCGAGQVGDYSVDINGGAAVLIPEEEECPTRGISRTGSSFEATEAFEIPQSALSETRTWSADASSPGLYQTTTFQPQVTFKLPPNWRSPAPDTESTFGMENSPAWMVFSTLSTDTLTERVSFLEGHENINIVSTESTEVGGMEAVKLDFTVSSDITLVLTTGLTGTATPEEKIQAWVVDVQGSVTTIFFGSTRPTFDSRAQDAATIIDSIVWG
jgi:hypothetical protein